MIDPRQDDFDEVERYELREPARYSFAANRRQFVQTLGAGLVVSVAARPARAQRGRTARREELLADRFHFGTDGIVTLYTSKVEVGQGARTQISQAAAEEFQIPVDRIRLIMADTQLCPDDGGTAGSRTTPSTVPRVRHASAAARESLRALATKQLGADVTWRDGVFRTSQGKTVSLAALAETPDLLAILQTAPPAEGITITAVKQWQVLGTSVPKVDAKAIVTGSHQFPSDIILPEMLYGKVLRPPTIGSRLVSVDIAVAQQDGVTAVRDGDFVGCVASTSWQAKRACDALAATATWQASAEMQPSSDQLAEHFKKSGRESSGGRDRAKIWGDVDGSLSRATKRIDQQYTIAYVQHAPMEPRAAVAQWNAGELTVWTGSQQPARVQSQLCEAFRLPSESVRVIVPDTGGGFGGKHTGEAAVEAARLAKSAGKPVHLRWTREEEFTWAYFRPAGLIEISAAVDETGTLASWDFSNYNSGGSAIDTPYAVPHGRTRFLGTDAPLRQGSYRALASTANVFAREVAMDELAELADMDPLEFRLRLLPPGRLRDVLSAAAKRFDWATRAKQREPNRGIGLSCGTEKGSYTAACVEVEVAGGEVRVISATQSFECGAIQNPANLRRQVEGCLVMGLGAALFEEIKFAGGRIANPSFSAYQVPRMHDLPELDIVLLDRPDLPSVGGSETPIIAIAPAIANAVYFAVGKRCRSMPIRIR